MVNRMIPPRAPAPFVARVGWHGTIDPGGSRHFGPEQRCGFMRINIDALRGNT